LLFGAPNSEEFNKTAHFRALRRGTVFGNVRARFASTRVHRRPSKINALDGFPELLS
jgi:hypothetical protein